MWQTLSMLDYGGSWCRRLRYSEPSCCLRRTYTYICIREGVSYGRKGAIVGAEPNRRVGSAVQQAIMSPSCADSRRWILEDQAIERHECAHFNVPTTFCAVFRSVLNIFPRNYTSSVIIKNIPVPLFPTITNLVLFLYIFAPFLFSSHFQLKELKLASCLLLVVRYDNTSLCSRSLYCPAPLIPGSLESVWKTLFRAFSCSMWTSCIVC